MRILDATALVHVKSRKQNTATKSKKLANHDLVHKTNRADVALAIPAIRQPLDLSLPPPADTVNEDESTKASRRTARNNDNNTKSTLDLNASIDSPEFDPDQPDKLFNRDNGLRGFMKQSWLNQNIGLQGGLAIKPERLRENNSDLEENMAVGMGVLLAF